MGFPPSSGLGEVVLGVPDRITEASDLTKKFIGLIDQHVMAGFWDLNELAQRKGVDQFAPGGRGEQMTFASPDEKGRAADLPGIRAGGRAECWIHTVHPPGPRRGAAGLVLAEKALGRRETGADMPAHAARHPKARRDLMLVRGRSSGRGRLYHCVTQSATAPSQRSVGADPPQDPNETKSRAWVAGASRTSRPSQPTHAGVILPLFSRVAKALHDAMLCRSVLHHTQLRAAVRYGTGRHLCQIFVCDRIHNLKRLCVGAHSLLQHQCCSSAPIENTFVWSTTVLW